MIVNSLKEWGVEDDFLPDVRRISTGGIGAGDARLFLWMMSVQGLPLLIYMKRQEKKKI